MTIEVNYNSNTRTYELYDYNKTTECVAVFSKELLGDELAKLLAYSSMKKLFDYYKGENYD